MTALNPGSKVFKLVLRRDDTGESWGFRLQGGKDLQMPISVAMVSSLFFSSNYLIKCVEFYEVSTQVPVNQLGC